jgi:hypothetical protein
MAHLHHLATGGHFRADNEYLPQGLAGNVADMLPTCQRDTAANFSRNGMLQQHKTCKKRPRHTQFIPIKADKFKSAQTYEYPSYHRVFDKTTNMLSNVVTCRQMSCCLDTLANMQSRQVADMTEDVSATCCDTTHLQMKAWEDMTD